MMDAKFQMQNSLLALCILHFALCAGACSIPNPETQQCSEARDSVKEFYSWYLGTDPEQRNKQPDVFRKYISAASPLNSTSSDVDPFFNSTTTPTTFKIAKCETPSADHTNIQVQLYWRQEQKTEQREVYADTAKVGDRWQIEKIENR
jgi:hypothetical protein